MPDFSPKSLLYLAFETSCPTTVFVCKFSFAEYSANLCFKFFIVWLWSLAFSIFRFNSRFSDFMRFKLASRLLKAFFNSLFSFKASSSLNLKSPISESERVFAGFEASSAFAKANCEVKLEFKSFSLASSEESFLDSFTSFSSFVE